MVEDLPNAHALCAKLLDHGRQDDQMPDELFDRIVDAHDALEAAVEAMKAVEGRSVGDRA